MHKWLLLKQNEWVLNPHTVPYQSCLFCLWSKLLNLCTHISWWWRWETQQRDFIILFLPVITETSRQPTEWWQVRQIVFIHDIEFGNTLLDFLDLNEWWSVSDMKFDHLPWADTGENGRILRCSLTGNILWHHN